MIEELEGVPFVGGWKGARGERLLMHWYSHGVGSHIDAILLLLASTSVCPVTPGGQLELLDPASQSDTE